MLTFSYEAKNPSTGKKVKAQVQADNEQAAAKAIRAEGLTPLSIQLEKNQGGRRFGRIRTKDKVLFSRQLATLINAGVPLVQSLRSGTRVRIDVPQTIADGAQTQLVGEFTFAVIRELVTDVVTVSDTELVETMKFFAGRMKIV